MYLESLPDYCCLSSQIPEASEGRADCASFEGSLQESLKAASWCSSCQIEERTLCSHLLSQPFSFQHFFATLHWPTEKRIERNHCFDHLLAHYSCYAEPIDLAFQAAG